MPTDQEKKLADNFATLNDGVSQLVRLATDFRASLMRGEPPHARVDTLKDALATVIGPGRRRRPARGVASRKTAGLARAPSRHV